MIQQIEKLVALQKIESDTRRLQSLLMEMPGRLARLNAEQATFEQTIASDLQRVKDLQKQYRDYEADAETIEGRMAKSQEKLHMVKTNKEYRTSLREIDQFKQQNSKIEDEMLACLDLIESAETSLAQRRNQQDEVVTRIQADQRSIEQEKAKKQEDLDRFEDRRQVVCRQVEAGLLQKYFSVRDQHPDGIAIVSVKDAICHGCNLNIPAQLYNELQRNDSLKFCPFCQRIIYWQPE